MMTTILVGVADWPTPSTLGLVCTRYMSIPSFLQLVNPVAELWWDWLHGMHTANGPHGWTLGNPPSSEVLVYCTPDKVYKLFHVISALSILTTASASWLSCVCLHGVVVGTSSGLLLYPGVRHKLPAWSNESVGPICTISLRHINDQFDECITCMLRSQSAESPGPAGTWGLGL